MQKKNNLLFRKLTEKDIRNWQVIERRSFIRPWSIEDLYYSLDITGMEARVLEWNVDSEFKDSRVQLMLGYAIYRILDDHIYLSSLAVMPEIRREKYGTLMVEKIKDYQKPVKVFVHEGNTKAHLFFQNLNFKGVRVHPKYYGGHEAAFEMVYNKVGS